MTADSDLEILHNKLWTHIDEQKKNWKSFVYAQDRGFYQGLEELKIDGWRPSEKRLRHYDINKYFSNEKVALDIGCNVGFFTIVVSRFVKHIDGLDINPYLINIASDVMDFLKIKNISFHRTSFEDFMPTKKYDLVFSLGNDETIDGNTRFTFSEYVEKIYKLLQRNGILIFESQAVDAYYPDKFKPKLDKLKSLFEIIENKIVQSEYPVNVPNRIFIVLKRRS